jgi:5-methylcytosine-specific restriction endonuclease McrA
LVNLVTLVLNPDFTPISLLGIKTESAKDALLKVLNGNAIRVVDYDRIVLTPSRNDLLWPSVIANRVFHNRKHTKTVRLSHESLLIRDPVCQYCGKELTIHTITYDHVIPQSNGGKHTWDNVVGACKKCNNTKGQHAPIGKWKPKKPPYIPTIYELREKRRVLPITVHDPAWLDYISPGAEWEGPITVKNYKYIPTIGDL